MNYQITLSFIGTFVALISFIYLIIRNFREDLSDRLNTINYKFDKIDKRFESIDNRFESIDNRLTHIESRLSS